MPFVGAVIYCGTKLINWILKLVKWVKSHKIVNTNTPKKKPVKVTVNVVDPFATI